MVRSLGESELSRDLSHLAEALRSAEKYFDVSFAEIERKLDAVGEGEWLCEVEVEDENGDPVAAELRLNVSCQNQIRTSWTFSIKLHKKLCLDRIDYESRYPTGGGNFGRGWHRHTWDRSRGNCDNRESGKQPLKGLEQIPNRAGVLQAVFKEFRVTLNRYDHGTDELPFD
jgi:hypothetical protein